MAGAEKARYGPAIGQALDLNQFAKPEKGGISAPTYPPVKKSMCQGPTAAVAALYQAWPGDTDTGAG